MVMQFVGGSRYSEIPVLGEFEVDANVLDQGFVPLDAGATSVGLALQRCTAPVA